MAHSHTSPIEPNPQHTQNYDVDTTGTLRKEVEKHFPAHHDNYNPYNSQQSITSSPDQRKITGYKEEIGRSVPTMRVAPDKILEGNK